MTKNRKAFSSSAARGRLISKTHRNRPATAQSVGSMLLFQRTKLFAKGTLRPSTALPRGEVPEGTVGYDVKLDNKRRCTPVSDLRYDFDATMKKLETHCPANFAFARNMSKIAKATSGNVLLQNRERSTSIGIEMGRGEEEVHLPAATLNPPPERWRRGRKAIQGSKAQQEASTLLSKIRNVKAIAQENQEEGSSTEGEGEEGGEEAEAEVGPLRLEVEEGLGTSAMPGPSSPPAHTLLPRHAEIALHSKHIMPNLVVRQMKTFETAVKGSSPSGRPAWIEKYHEDKFDYNSLSVHASMKIEEARYLSSKGIFPQHTVVAICVHHLLESMPRILGVSPRAQEVIEGLMGSVFILEEGGSSKRLITERKTLKEILELPTYFDLANRWYCKLKVELKQRPELVKKLDELRKERVLEAKVLERACDKWANHILRNIIFRWRSELEMSGKRLVMGKYLLHMTSLKPRTVFVKWREWQMGQKATREKTRWRNTKRDAEMLKKKTEEKVDAVKGMQSQVWKLKRDIERLKKELEKYLAILHMPARQRKTLAKIVRCFGKSFASCNLAFHVSCKKSIARECWLTRFSDQSLTLYSFRNILAA